MMRSLQVILGLCLVAVLAAGARADTVSLKSGTTVEGRIIERTEESVKVDVDGVVLTFYADELADEPADQPRSSVSPDPENIPVPKTPGEIFDAVLPATVIVKVYRAEGGGVGSGFLISPSGVILTNFHVAVGARRIDVQFNNGTVLPVEGVISFDPLRDICLLKVSAQGLPAVPVGDPGTLIPGDPVVAVGTPEGKRLTMTEGVFSGRRFFCGLNHLQFTAPITLGNSGGPLVNARGEAVGVVTFKRWGTSSYNFAIPIEEAKPKFGEEVSLTFDQFAQGVSRAYELFHQGQDAYSRGDIPGAIALLEQSLQADPSYLEARFGLAELYLSDNRMEESFPLWQQLVRDDPENVEARVNYGVACVGKGLFREAAEHLEEAVRLDPDKVEAWDNLGVAYGRLKDHDAALKAHRKAVSLDSKYAIGFYNLATVYYNMGDFQAAIEASDRAEGLGFSVPPEFSEMLKPHRHQINSGSVP